MSMLLRARGQHHAPVGMVELFFDLVFVFAITQLSHALVADLSVGNALRCALLAAAVWWVWVYTAWATNWLEPERPAVRGMLFAMMLGGLLMAAAIPKAFGELGLLFAAAYVAMQLGRTGFTLWAMRQDKALRLNFLRIIIWLAAAAPFWLLGGVLEGWWRFAAWAVAVGIEYASPAMYFRVPGLGRSTTGDWTVEGAHMAERCALFILIALGETLLMTGATFAASAHLDAPTVAALLTGFAGTLAMWWLYFDRGAAQGTRHITSSGDPGRMARAGYTYLHLPIVAGILVAAVADEVVLHHPLGQGSTLYETAVILGGPALFLAGCAAFKAIPLGWWPLSHRAGLGLLGLLTPAAMVLPPVGLAGATVAVMVLVAAWEKLSFGPGAARMRA